MKKLLSIIMALCSVMGAQAIEISESEAAKIASEFVTSHGFGATRGDASLTLAKSSQGYYAYNRGAGAGFVIVAADDAMGAQVLGYSASGSLDFDKLPCNLKWWLAQYDRMAATGASFPQASATRADAKAAIEPLVSCQWNQDSPYNDLCPEYAAGMHSATGCAATATAQVMYCHKYPEHGTGSNSYFWQNGGKTLSMDFSEHVYDWNSMTDTYDKNSSETSREAVALLMRDCGYAENMNYYYESFTYPYEQPKALINHFGYDRGIKLIMRRYYSYDEWNDILYAELAAKRPILTGGGAHAFVTDGYKQEDGYDWYHINWGWGGMSDGYFVCANLNPSSLGIGAGGGSYSQNLTAAIGIQPAIEGSVSVPELYCDAFAPTTVKKGGEVTFKTTIASSCVIDSVFIFGLKVVNESAQTVAYVKNDTATTLSPFKEFTGLTMSLKDFPTDEGTYDVYPVYFVGDKEYSIRVPSNQPSFTKATVKGDEIIFTYGEDFVSPTVSKVTVIDEEPIYARFPFNVSAVVTAEDKEYCGNLNMCLVKDPEAPDSIISSSDALAIDLRKGESVNAKFSISAPNEAGTYYAIFVDGNNRIARCDTTPIIITPLPEDDLKWEASVKIYNPTDFDPATDSLSVDCKLTCTSGYYIGTIYMIFTDEDDIEIPVTLGNWMLVAGQYMTYKGKMPPLLFNSLEYGTTYNVSLGYKVDGEKGENVIPCDATLTTIQSSGINGVTTGGEPQTIKIYSLGGKLVTTQKATTPNLSTLPAGAYIVKIGDKAQKMVSGK